MARLDKFKFTLAERKEIAKKFESLNGRELFAHMTANFPITCQYTTFRTALYNLGLYKCRMTRWTEKEVNFLLAHYKTMGNIEIAEKLSTKRRKFTKKKIEKKMRLMGLKRTRAEINGIIAGHKEKGTFHKANLERWKTIKEPEGHKHVVLCNGVPKWRIKINGMYIPYQRYRYIQLHGEIPPGYRVYHKDMDPLNIDDDNLIIRNHTLNAAERMRYKRNIERYLRQEKTKNEYATTAPAVAAPVLVTQNVVSLRIDAKTVISVKPGTNINELREKYSNHMQISQQLDRLNSAAQKALPDVKKVKF